MSKTAVNHSVVIAAPSSQVWRMFNDAEFTRQMGGEYVSDWKVGSSIGWMGPDGVMFTDGVILQIQPGLLLQHSLFHPDTDEPMATVTYRLDEKDGKTTVKIIEQFTEPVTDDDHDDALGGWEAALDAVKELLESGA